MSIQDDIGGRQAPFLEPTPAALSNFLASVVNYVEDLKARIKAHVENQFVPPGQAAGQAMGKVVAWVEYALETACVAETACVEKIRNWIETKLGSAAFCSEGMQGKIDKAQKRLTGRAEKAKTRAADASSARGEQPLQSAATSNAKAEESASRGIDAPASFLPTSAPIPSPPVPGELSGLVAILGDDQGALPLEALPGEFWQADNANRVFLTLEPSVLTRATIQTLRIRGEAIEPAGVIYFNVGLPVPPESIQTMLGELGLASEGFQVLSDLDAWNQAVERFGENVALQFWDLYSLPHPQVITSVLPPLTGPGSPPNPFSGKGPFDDVVDAMPFRQQAGELGARMMRVVQAGPVGVAANVAERFGLRIPTLAELCELVAPVVAYFGLDVHKMPPCATVNECKAYLDSLAKR